MTVPSFDSLDALVEWLLPQLAAEGMACTREHLARELQRAGVGGIVLTLDNELRDFVSGRRFVRTDHVGGELIGFFVDDGGEHVAMLVPVEKPDRLH